MAATNKKSKASSGSGSAISQRWLDLFALIPGYDPVATAEDCWFDEGVADNAVAFFAECLTHIEGELAGRPLALAPWQQAQVGCAFGWKRPDGTRRYREVFDYEPRKNGKSTKLGGLINLVAFCDNEPGAQIYCAAADREQAALVYRQAKGMVINNPELEEQVKIYATYKSIEYPGGTVFKALSSDADTKHGFNTHFVCIDELHAHRGRDLVDVLVTSTGARRQPLIWYITTADFDRDSICNEKYKYACKVRDGLVQDKAFLPVIFEALPSDDWRDPKVWAKANPNLGVSVGLDYIERECKRAQETPTYENTFKRLHLNIRTQNDVRWITLEDWDGCAGEPINEADFYGRDCYMALDLSSKFDVTAAVKLFPPLKEGGKWTVLPRFWIPAVGAEQRERRDRVPYQTWARQGYIGMTEGNVIDYAAVEQSIRADAKLFTIREVAYDPWNATHFALRLQEDGFKVVEYNQRMQALTEPTKELERLIRQGTLWHGGNPVMRWMASHVQVKQDEAGNIRPVKLNQNDRIDGIVATIMALGRAMVAAKADPEVSLTII